MCELNDVIQEPVVPIMFFGVKCCIRLETYSQKDPAGINRKAIILEQLETGEDVAVATINIPEEPLAADEIVIKDYSENEGMLSTLVLARVISVPIRFTKNNHFPICKLLLPCKQN